MRDNGVNGHEINEGRGYAEHRCKVRFKDNNDKSEVIIIKAMGTMKGQ